ncbi:hypothetical protein [Nocardioides sp.]
MANHVALAATELRWDTASSFIVFMMPPSVRQFSYCSHTEVTIAQ